MHEVLVNRSGGLNLPRKSVVTLTDRSDMTLDVYRGRKTTMQQIRANTISTVNYKHNSNKKLDGDMVLVLCISFDHALYLYHALQKHRQWF